MAGLLPSSTGNHFCKVRSGNGFALQTSQLPIYPENTPSKSFTPAQKKCIMPPDVHKGSSRFQEMTVVSTIIDWQLSVPQKNATS